MLEILEQIIQILLADTTLTNTVPGTSIFAGPVDITMEKQANLLYPQINIRTVGEVQHTVPIKTRETQIQLDIWSRNNLKEIETIYERVLTLLSYKSADKATAHIFWQRLNGAVDDYESDRRVWHRACTFTVWAVK